MRTMLPGSARRQDTAEAVRGRMANLFTLPSPASGDRSGPSRPVVTASHSVPPGAAPPGAAADLDPDLDPAVPDPAAPEPSMPEPVEPDPLTPDPPAHDPVTPDPAPPGRRRMMPDLPPGLSLDRRAVVGLGVLLLLAVGYAVQHFWLGRPEPVPVPATTVAESPERPAGAGPPGTGPPGTAGPSGSAGPSVADESGGPTGPGVVVDVAGRVLHPGLLKLPAGARVADALGAAGGPLPGTDTQSLNLARVLTDGEQILVGLPGAQPAATGPATRAGPLSLNRATVEQLDALPGVGPTLAQRIIQFRQEHGSFRSLDQLRQVSGIGVRKYEELKSLLSL
ncbi:helix-hairpin-helix domain-containing protein [Kitasatospora sp. NPDC088346]|uniref:helix-hairpin-helix domain-containing protein n=1 Tax=Kitasatospora sp. NPDC088346 TaxID=3364073 RepID=UPI0038136473